MNNKNLELCFNLIVIGIEWMYTEKTVSLNQKNIPLIYDQWKNFFELKKLFFDPKK